MTFYSTAVEKLAVPPSETHTNNTWLIVGVVAPVVLAVGIVAILYWKLCRSDKLEFQPDAISTIQQRQKMKEVGVHPLQDRVCHNIHILCSSAGLYIYSFNVGSTSMSFLP